MGLIELTVRGQATEPTRDENGDFVYGEVTRSIFARSVYAQTSSDGTAPNRDSVTTGRVIIAVAGTVVHPHEQVQIDGEWWEVDGKPAEWDEKSQPLRRVGFRMTGWKLPDIGLSSVVINVKQVTG